MALHFITRVRNESLTRNVGSCIVLVVVGVLSAIVLCLIH